LGVSAGIGEGPVDAQRVTAWRSLRWRLVGLFLLFAAGTTIVFLIGMQHVLHGGWQSYVRPLVANYLDRLAADIGTPPDVARAQALVDRLPIAIRIEGPVVNWDSDPGHNHLAHHHGWPRLSTDMPHDNAAFEAVEPPGQESGWWQVRTLSDGHRIIFGLANPPNERRPRYIGWATLSLLLLFTALAYAAVRHLLKPLNDIRRGAERFGRGDFDRTIPQRQADELGALASQINTMAARLRGMLDAKRALLLAISHELRSPLTRARLNAELIEDTTGSGAREALLRDLAEMRDLVTDLLESERLAGGHAVLQAEPTLLDDLVREEVAAHFDDRALRLDLACDGGPLMLDRVRIRLLLRNLIDNALRHSADASEPPTVSTRWDGTAEGRAGVLRVRDHGPGVPEAHLAHLAEPFYRADSARQRATGGVGLGLYLCRLVAEAHRDLLPGAGAGTGAGGGATEGAGASAVAGQAATPGVWQVRNAQPGLLVEVRLPAAPASARACATPTR
jgi:signal transduction histidine kinase